MNSKCRTFPKSSFEGDGASRNPFCFSYIINQLKSDLLSVNNTKTSISKTIYTHLYVSTTLCWHCGECRCSASRGCRGQQKARVSSVFQHPSKLRPLASILIYFCYYTTTKYTRRIQKGGGGDQLPPPIETEEKCQQIYRTLFHAHLVYILLILLFLLQSYRLHVIC